MRNLIRALSKERGVHFSGIVVVDDVVDEDVVDDIVEIDDVVVILVVVEGLVVDV